MKYLSKLILENNDKFYHMDGLEFDIDLEIMDNKLIITFLPINENLDEHDIPKLSDNIYYDLMRKIGYSKKHGIFSFEISTGSLIDLIKMRIIK